MKIKPIKPEEINEDWIDLSKDLMNQAINNLLMINYDDSMKNAIIKESEIILEYLKVTGQQNTREVRKAIYASDILDFEDSYGKYWNVMYITETEPVDEMYEPYYVFTNMK